MNRPIDAVVAGHICLDVIPGLAHLPVGKFSELLKPGHLIISGPATFSTGGPVSNTGLALHRLGISTRLIAKVGGDPYGTVVRQLVERYDPDLTGGLVIDPGETTSYSVILSAPGVDRIFLHCPGANDTFGSEDVNYNLVAQARLFHFGYPPLMRRAYIDEGEELVRIFQKAKACGTTTSLDFAFPDPGSEGGKAPWPVILGKVLPFVDIFLPSFEEILFCLRRETYEELNLKTNGCLLEAATPDLVSDLGKQILDLGVKIAVIKLGDHGLYVRTSDSTHLEEMGAAAPMDPGQWSHMELRAACFKVNVVGTTGSGDATIAGFLSGFLRGLGPRETVTAAVAVGACNVEAADALSGLCSWEDTLARINAGWTKLPVEFMSPGWEAVGVGLWQKSILDQEKK
jgi:sugar/nucleoside kinase (ribokinase family)